MAFLMTKDPIPPTEAAVEALNQNRGPLIPKTYSSMSSEKNIFLIMYSVVCIARGLRVHSLQPQENWSYA
jgi:hypothetical protein